MKALITLKRLEVLGTFQIANLWTWIFRKAMDKSKVWHRQFKILKVATQSTVYTMNPIQISPKNQIIKPIKMTSVN